MRIEDWSSGLKKFNETASKTQAKAAPNPKLREKEVLKHLRALYREEDRKKHKLLLPTNTQSSTSSSSSSSVTSSPSVSRPSSSSSFSSSSLSSSSSGIPRFYLAASSVSDLRLKVLKEARARFLERKANDLMDDIQLAQLWEAISTNASFPPHTPRYPKRDTTMNSANTSPRGSSDESSGKPPAAVNSTTGFSSNPSSSSGFDCDKRMNYDDFTRIIHSLAHRKADHYLTHKIFLRFPRDQYGRISCVQLFRYIFKKSELSRVRIALTCYDEVGHGYLREHDLENYIYDQIPHMSQLNSALEQEFWPYYVFTATRKFFFFLDPHKKGKIAIRALVHSPLMAEFMALREPIGGRNYPPPYPTINLGNPNGGMGMAIGMVSAAGGAVANVVGGLGKKKKRSWFSPYNAQDLYSVYLQLDVDRNGMLSSQEFTRVNGGTMTNSFVSALFQSIRMFANQKNGEMEMDYKMFLEFMLANEYKQTIASLTYFFRILDIKHQGYLDLFTIYYWFRAVTEKMSSMGIQAHGLDPAILLELVPSEIFDMVTPMNAERITLQDLLKARCGHTVLAILIDVNSFWKYDNRENLMHQDETET